MHRVVSRALIVALIIFASHARGAALPPLRVPDCLGVNIHFDDPLPGEMEMIKAGGFRIVRADLIWNQVELHKGSYEWTRFDRLLDACAKHGLRVLMPLDYSNPLYDNDLSPHSEEGVAAFARFAVAAVTHYKGRGVIWEMYNEPNNVFWRPQPDVNAYIRLAMAVGKAIKLAAPDELYVGPALSGTDGAWLEPCYRAGLLDYWDAVTVHPYGNAPPEERARHYAGSRALIDRYRPKGKAVPLLSGEWGYTSAQFTPQMQGKLLARQFLFNLSQGIGLSIWYDWRDDGTDPKNPEHSFGVVEHAARKGEIPPFTPKPAYRAAQTLGRQLDGLRFARRIRLKSDDDYLLVFEKPGAEMRAAAWTSSAKPHTATLPATAGRFAAVSFDGSPLPPMDAAADGIGLSAELTDGPIYVTPPARQPSWQ